MRQASGQERYVRRLPDKIIWAVEQAVDQGRSHLAPLLNTIYSEAKSDEDRIRCERRKEH